MSRFVTLVLEPSFNDEYGEYANLPVFNAHGDVVGYTGGEVPETGNPCEFYVMDEEGFPVCHSAYENAKLRELVEYMHRCFVRGHDWGPYCAGETVWVEQRMRELGIELNDCE